VQLLSEAERQRQATKAAMLRAKHEQVEAILKVA